MTFSGTWEVLGQTGTVGTPLQPPTDSVSHRDRAHDTDLSPEAYPREPLRLDPPPSTSVLPRPSRRRTSKPRSQPRVRRSRKASASAATALYRYYDADDVLLYVGITGDLAERELDHICDSTWMDFAARSTIERFPTRDEAEDAERDAIRDDAPLFNIAHNDTPGMTRRLVEYLVKQNRLDLLMPAVSRG